MLLAGMLRNTWWYTWKEEMQAGNTRTLSVRDLRKLPAQAWQAGVKSCLDFSLREGPNFGHVICYRMIWGISRECSWASSPSFSKMLGESIFLLGETFYNFTRNVISSLRAQILKLDCLGSNSSSGFTISCVSSGNILHLPEPQFPHL